MKGFSIVGIGTDVGKTVVSAILSEALEAAYFKPVQAGDLENSDRIKIKKWCSEAVVDFPEVFKLTEPMAPHGAAKIDGVELSTSKIIFPKTNKPLILEGAGGLLVPLNEKETFADIYKKAGLPAIVVSRHYLGSINHTFLTFEILKKYKIDIAGIIYVGEENKTTESIIESFYTPNVLGRIVLPEDINSDFIKSEASKFSHLIYEL